MTTVITVTLPLGQIKKKNIPTCPSFSQKKIVVFNSFFHDAYVFPAQIIFEGTKLGELLERCSGCFVASANKFIFYPQQTYTISILQCQKVQNNRHTLMKKAETNDILNIFYCVLYHVRDYTDAVSYHSLYMNQVWAKLYYLND